MSRSSIKQALIENNARAQEQADAVHADPDMSEDEVIEHVHRYICYKFRLDPDASHGLCLDELAQASIERAQETGISSLGDDVARTGCDAADSASVKKALLMKALQRDLAYVAPLKLVFARDTDEIGAAVYECLKGKGIDHDQTLR